jgi:RNA polymerase sigma-54 factor
MARVEATLMKVQSFDPPGIFARNLAECLALQLRDRNRLDPAIQALLDHLDLLAKRDFEALRRVCRVDADDMADMIAEIKALNPKPASAFDHIVAQPIVPDVFVRRREDGTWLVELNSEALPRVLVNTRYFATVNKHARSKAEKDYLVDRLNSANWLVKSLHQRAQTILKVATELVNQQEVFFTRGVQYLKPLTLRDVAEVIGVHESTVSRVTNNKYLGFSRGVYEMKFFFTSAIGQSAEGENLSAESIRYRIKALIDRETPDGVLSDDKIVDMLRRDGVEIARRTVAKYREAMHIPSSVQRRREKTLHA